MKNIFEGFTEEGTPDLKYYAFDWDDNIVYMPTKIVLKNKEGKEDSFTNIVCWKINEVGTNVITNVPDDTSLPF